MYRSLGTGREQQQIIQVVAGQLVSVAQAQEGVDGRVVGAVLRTRTAVKPLYVSVGHKVSLTDAVRWTLRCSKGFRLPEPTRLAHQLVSRAKADHRYLVV